MASPLPQGDERRSLIRRWLREGGTRTTAEVQQFLARSAFRVTIDTIQRDLRRLETDGSVRCAPYSVAGHEWGGCFIDVD